MVLSTAHVAANSGLQTLSRTLFGQSHRLAVMLAVARSDGIVNPTELADVLSFRAQSSLQAPLRDLESAGLITRLPRTGGKMIFFSRNPSLVWDWVEELVATRPGA